jgi:hypothetical protein
MLAWRLASMEVMMCHDRVAEWSRLEQGEQLPEHLGEVRHWSIPSQHGGQRMRRGVPALAR